jgi:hypothetical protein
VPRIPELLDGLLSKFENKKIVCNIVSLITGLLLSIYGNLYILGALSGTSKQQQRKYRDQLLHTKRKSPPCGGP